jgi:aspartate-semialdehyde dehydrogenase
MRLAIIGSTGLVGRQIIEVLIERKFNFSELILVASKKSVGNTLIVADKSYKICSIDSLLEKKPDLALFSAGSSISLKWAPMLAKLGCKVIDNSSCWRMDDRYKLIIPEVNGSELTKKDMIISNPNCSTIQLLVVLFPLHKKYNIERAVVSTYQSPSGSGEKAINQLFNEEQGVVGEMVYPHPIYRNALPHIDVFQENGYTKEEMKIVNETHKILDKKINVTATAVRVPIDGGHCESVNLTFSSDFEIDNILTELSNSPGIVVKDNVEKNVYPMPIYSKGSDDVFVGRIRRDFSLAKSLNLWIVSDNLRKGAATNTVQIAEYLLENNILK